MNKFVFPHRNGTTILSKNKTISGHKKTKPSHKEHNFSTGGALHTHHTLSNQMKGIRIGGALQRPENSTSNFLVTGAGTKRHNPLTSLDHLTKKPISKIF